MQTLFAKIMKNLTMERMETINGEDPISDGELNDSLNYVATDHWMQFPPVSKTAHITMATLTGIIMIISIIGNSTVLGVVLRFRTLRTPGNILIANLACSDLLMVVFGCPMMIVSSLHGQWVFGEFGCQLYGATGTIFGLMSINTLVFISAERYFIIVHPEGSRKFTNGNIYCYLIIIWLYSVLWGIFPFIGWGSYTIEGFGTTCSINYLTDDSADKYLLLGMFLCDFLVPIVAITYFYIRIYSAVVQHRQLYGDVLTRDSPKTNKQFVFKFKPNGSLKVEWKRVSSCLSGSSYNSVASSVLYRSWSKTEYKITRTTIVVILLFCISWMPYAVITMIGQYGDQHLITPFASMIPVIFAKASTIYNPIIYFLSHPRFATKIKSVFPWFLCFGKKISICWPENRAVNSGKSITIKSPQIAVESKEYLSQGSRSSSEDEAMDFALVKMNTSPPLKPSGEKHQDCQIACQISNYSKMNGLTEVDSHVKSNATINWTDRVSRGAVWKGVDARANLAMPFMPMLEESKAISSESLTEIDMMAIALEMRSLFT